MAQKLSEMFKNDELTRFIEEYLYNEEIIIDQGFYLEVYTNYDGKHDENSSEGSSLFVFIDMDITYGNLLSLFDDFSVKDDTLTITILGIDEGEERLFCLENPISPMILPKVLSGTFKPNSI